MNWSAYIVAVLLALSFDSSVGSVLEIAGAHPQVLPAVVVFALLSTARRCALRAAMLAGLAADLLAPLVGADGMLVVVPGPRVLGFALGALAVLQLRSLLYRRNPLAGSAATFAFSLLAGIVFIAASLLRAWVTGSDAPWWPGTGGSEVWIRFIGALLDGVVALPVLWCLEKTRPLWGFVVSTKLTAGPARMSR